MIDFFLYVLDGAADEPRTKKAKKGSKAALANHTATEISNLKLNGHVIAGKVIS